MSETANVFTPTPTGREGPGAQALLQVARMLKVQLKSTFDVARVTRAGLGTDAIENLVEQGFTRSETGWIIAPRTLNHRRSRNEKLTSEETARLLRAAKLQAMAEIVLGNTELARHWLHQPRKAFDDLSAMEMMRTEAGGQIVEEALGQLDAGYFA